MATRERRTRSCTGPPTQPMAANNSLHPKARDHWPLLAYQGDQPQRSTPGKTGAEEQKLTRRKRKKGTGAEAHQPQNRAKRKLYQSQRYAQSAEPQLCHIRQQTSSPGQGSFPRFSVEGNRGRQRRRPEAPRVTFSHPGRPGLL